MSGVNPITLFVSGHTRAQWAQTLLVVVVLVDLFAIATDYAEINMLSRMNAGEIIGSEEAEANATRQGIVGTLQFLALLTTAVFFLMWIHRVHQNLPALGARHLKYSPRWAVGGFFVPFLNLVRPFQVVSEIWKASDPSAMDDHSWQTTPASPLLGWWWALFLISQFLGNIAGRMALSGGETVSDLLTASRVMLVADLVEVPSAISAILVVRAIDARQEEKSKRLARLGVVQHPTLR